MKSIFTLSILLFTSMLFHAQSNFFNEAYRFNKFMDRVSSDKGKQLTYGDIEGSAYFSKSFISAGIENATSLIKTRYNTYTDTVELLNEEEIFELPKSEKYGRITFLNPQAVLIYLAEGDVPAGYYFELVQGKYSLLKKVKTTLRPELKGLNSFTPDLPPRFESENPEYFLKTPSAIIRIPKKAKDLLSSLSDKNSETADFIKKNSLKLNQENDLVKLTEYLNK